MHFVRCPSFTLSEYSVSIQTTVRCTCTPRAFHQKCLDPVCKSPTCTTPPHLPSSKGRAVLRLLQRTETRDAPKTTSPFYSARGGLLDLRLCAKPAVFMGRQVEILVIFRTNHIDL